MLLTGKLTRTDLISQKKLDIEKANEGIVLPSMFIYLLLSVQFRR